MRKPQVERSQNDILLTSVPPQGSIMYALSSLMFSVFLLQCCCFAHLVFTSSDLGVKTHSNFQETAQDEGSTCRSRCDSWIFLFPQKTLTTKEEFPLVPKFPWEWCHCVMAIGTLTIPCQDPILSPLFCQRKKKNRIVTPEAAPVFHPAWE